jgi:hypothetical protein
MGRLGRLLVGMRGRLLHLVGRMLPLLNGGSF